MFPGKTAARLRRLIWVLLHEEADMANAVITMAFRKGRNMARSKRWLGAGLWLVLVLAAGPGWTAEGQKPPMSSTNNSVDQAGAAQAENPVPQGAVRSGIFTGKRLKPGAIFEYRLYVPKQYDPKVPAALYVCQDGLNPVQTQVMDKLIAEGAMPVCIGLFIYPATLVATGPGGADWGMRAEEYDQIGRDYPDFIIDEFLPYLRKKEGINLSGDPNLHLVGGGSSGGSCAWNMAWYRNDFFRRVCMFSPSFIAFRGGEELMVLARKSETKPIRAYFTVGTIEPSQYAGNSYLVALSADDALKYAGYDYRFEKFVNAEHCYGRSDPVIFERVLRYLWKDWRTDKVRPLRNPSRIERLVDLDQPWEETVEPMPERVLPKVAAGTYSFKGGCIFLTTKDGIRRTVADGFGEITALALSTDRWRLYVSDQSRRFVYALPILPDGSLQGRYILAPLHLAHDCITLGASDLCVDRQDRVYAATQLGIQGIISFGITDSILPLPGDLPVERLSFGGPGNSVLYAGSKGKVFKRSWKVRGSMASDPVTKPSTPGYND